MSVADLEEMNMLLDIIRVKKYEELKSSVCVEDKPKEKQKCSFVKIVKNLKIVYLRLQVTVDVKYVEK